MRNEFIWGFVAIVLAGLLISCEPSARFIEDVVIKKYGDSGHGWHKARGKSLSNPNVANARSLENGKSLYMELCQPCHGESGVGDGPEARALAKRPANLKESTKKHDDYFLYLQISLGRNGMPMWRKELNKTDRWDLVNYIKSL